MILSGAAPRSPGCSPRGRPQRRPAGLHRRSRRGPRSPAATGLSYAADHLSNALGQTVSPERLFARLAPRFAEFLALWRGGAGFAEIRARWLDHAAGLRGPIRVAGARGFREGLFETLDERGRLVLRGANGLEVVEAGDLFIDQTGAGEAIVSGGAPGAAAQPPQKASN